MNNNYRFEQVKQKLNIVSVAQQYGLKLDRGKCICPFHSDRNPSMSFKNQNFKCWSCGASGDVFDLVSRLLNVSTHDALKILDPSYEYDRAANIAYEKRRTKERQFSSWIEDTGRELNYIHRVLWWAKSNSEVFSDDWCFALRKLEWANYLIECLKGDPVGYYKKFGRIIDLT